jgi:DNA-binding transcriptional ArsR family regulator
MEMKQALDALTALAQETRLNIFRLLVEQGARGLPAGAIGIRLNLANATLSFHLKELSRADLVRAEPRGRSILYSANFETMNGLIAFLTENCCRESGEECLPEGIPVRRPAARARRTKRPRQ